MQGCDGSVLLDDTPTFTGEQTAIPNNNSLRGFDVVAKINDALTKECGGCVVSCADMLAMAANNSVASVCRKSTYTYTSLANFCVKIYLLEFSRVMFFSVGRSTVRRITRQTRLKNSKFQCCAPEPPSPIFQLRNPRRKLPSSFSKPNRLSCPLQCPHHWLCKVRQFCAKDLQRHRH